MVKSESSATTKSPPEIEPPKRPAGEDRRQAIVTALRGCMVEKGYSETSLTDIAKAVNMSVSHLLYYYPNKESILLDLYAEAADRLLSDATAHWDEIPEERLHLLAESAFAPGAQPKAVSSLNLEFSALANHLPELKARMDVFGTDLLAYLEDLFAKLPRQPGMSAADAAQLLRSTWLGLQANSNRDTQLSPEGARRLFRRTIFLLANLIPADPGPAAGPPRHARKGPKK